MSFRGAPTTVGERIAQIEEDLRRLKLGQATPVSVTPGGSATTQQITYSVPGDAAVGSGVIRWYPPFPITIEEVGVAADTPPDGDDLIVDVNKKGASMFASGDRPRVPDGANHGVSRTFLEGATELIVGDDVEVFGDYLTVDVDQVGSSTAGANITVIIRYRVTG